MPKNKKLALNSGLQTNQILTNDYEVCIPRASGILMAVNDINNFRFKPEMKHIPVQNYSNRKIGPIRLHFWPRKVAFMNCWSIFGSILVQTGNCHINVKNRLMSDLWDPHFLITLFSIEDLSLGSSCLLLVTLHNVTYCQISVQSFYFFMTSFKEEIG